MSSKSRAQNDGTNLIVNYLPQTVDEDELSSLFSECGMLESVKVIREGNSQISRGFAFVKYVDRASADKAVKRYTGYKMGKKTLRVSLSRPAGEETRDTNLIIENIPETWDDSELHECFANYGQIITHRVVKHIDGKSKCKAYVRYDMKDEAEDCITALHGVNVGGSKDLVVRFADAPVVKPTAELMNSKKNNRTATQPYPTPARPLRDAHMSRDHPGMSRDPGYSGSAAFPPAGRPARPLRDAPHPSYHRDMAREPGYPSPAFPPAGRPSRSRPGYYEGTPPPPDRYRDHPEAWGSKGPTPQPDISNLQIADHHRSSYDPEKGWCVFVFNLPDDASNETLYELFSKFGAINSVKPVFKGNNNHGNYNECKGYGFVHMLHYDEACRAIQSLDNMHYSGKSLQVRFKNSKKP